MSSMECRQGADHIRCHVFGMVENRRWQILLLPAVSAYALPSNLAGLSVRFFVENACVDA